MSQGADAQPRIPPGTRRDIGLVNAALARVIGLVAGGRAPNLFTSCPATAGCTAAGCGSPAA